MILDKSSLSVKFCCERLFWHVLGNDPGFIITADLVRGFLVIADQIVDYCPFCGAVASRVSKPEVNV